MKRIYSTCVLSCAFVFNALATEFVSQKFSVVNSDGIEIFYETTSSHTVDLIKNSSNKYAGTLSVPATVVNEGVTYTVTAVGKSAFSYNKSIVKLHIPNTIQEFKSSAFSNATSLDSISIYPVEGNTTPTFLSRDGIVYTDDLQEVVLCPAGKSGELVIPDGPVEIAEKAFSKCTKLTKLTLPESVEKIGYESFFSCYGLTQITLGKSVNYVGKSAFNGCSGLGSTGFKLPVLLDSIHESSFSNLTSAVSITLGENVKYVHPKAFNKNTSQTAFEVVSENDHFSVEDGVLYNTDKTTLVAYPVGKSDTDYTVKEGVKTIAKNAFFFAEKIQNLTISNTVELIDEEAFYQTKSLQTLTLGNGVETIGKNAFTQSTLTAIHWGTSLKTIGENAFSSIYTLESVTLPASVETLEDGVFFSTEALVSATLNEGLKHAGERVFGNSLIETIHIPSTLETYGAGAFDAEGLTAYTIASNNPNFKVVDGVLYSLDMKVFYSYPRGKAFVDNMFTLPEGIEVINKYACDFKKDYEKLVLPSTLKEIKSDAFRYNSNIDTLVSHATVPPIFGGSMEYSYSAGEDVYEYNAISGPKKGELIVVVPAGTSGAYMSAGGWSEYTNYVEAESTVVPMPIVSPEAGTYTVAFNPSVSCENSEAMFIYTLDGSEPTMDNGMAVAPTYLLYSAGEIKRHTISETTTLKVKTVLVDNNAIVLSETQTVNYVFSTSTGLENVDKQMLFYTINNTIYFTTEMPVTIYAINGKVCHSGLTKEKTLESGIYIVVTEKGTEKIVLP